MGPRTVLDTLRQSGSFKCLFPRPSSAGLDAVLLNTAGGVTGGDSFRFTGKAASGTTLTLTTQACERAYKAQPEEFGQIVNHLTVEPNARLNWLPQETILFNGSALDRRLKIELAPEAQMLMVEPLIFGRAAMGETLTDIRLRDRIEIHRQGRPVFLDAMRFSGDFHNHLARPHIANGAGAMALVVFASASAGAHLDAIRQGLPETAGASLIHDDLMVIRILADNGFALRRNLLPVLRRLNTDTLPRCWML
ncbi:urease accessory protein UreD [Ruegeria arenilitoris]|uniref:urease accessory protein UreD n=1 Tax=Ruegeria arenilitoris TaxID=1173585 RepID=UPI0020C3697D|nr:urease accessory protein UreD [Ruegeria arenilitoris]